MSGDYQQASPLAVLSSLLAPPAATPRPVRAALNDLLPGDGSWDEMVRWFGQQREWAELVASYDDVSPMASR